MHSITAIITAYRRPANIAPLVEAVRAQSAKAEAIWAWANEPTPEVVLALEHARLDRVVTSSDNARFHGRFALALLARTEYVALFDDDSIPGTEWFAHCLQTMQETPGILGTAGVVLDGPGYARRTMHGWQRPSAEVIEVDLVCQAWFLRTEWVRYLFTSPAVNGVNGEDIELSARAWRLGGVRSFCPAHPPDDRARWGSIRGMELGVDAAAASLRPGHLDEREAVVAAEISAGWKPLRLRGIEKKSDGLGRPPHEGDDARTSLHEDRLGRSPHQEDDVGTSSHEDDDLRSLHEMDDVGKSSHDVDNRGRLSYERDGLGRPSSKSANRLRLERYARPQTLLRRLRRRMQPGQTLQGTVANARHIERVAALLAGRWRNDAKRYFTKREVEKLFYRAGFELVSLTPCESSRLAEWRAAGSPARVAHGDLQISTVDAGEAEEFYADAYQFQARAAAPRDYGLTSIVIVTYNELAYTRSCLESIRFLTDEPYELIVVDNGSTDGTPEYLRAANDVTLIANAGNRGFPAAANQGMRAARGRQVLLLNNDLLVTTGWLRRMLEAMQGTGDREQGTEVERARTVGLVGPCSNYVSGPQQVSAEYDDLSALDGFAWDWGKRNAGRCEAVDRLVGFCLLISREVIDRVGLLDERFGIGNFEDDDYCRRAAAAGFQMVNARDAFVHHFGHRSFAAAGVHLRALLERNQRLYEEKWAAEEGTGHRGQGTEKAQGSGTVSRPLRGFGGERRGQETCGQENWQGRETLPERAGEGTGDREQGTETSASALPCPLSPVTCSLSLCMIVRDNERTIRACLESIRPWVDEMIVVDTGSGDATPKICRELGARVEFMAWPDSFAEARNESLKYARGEWIFWMDSDDVIDAENGRKLRELARRPAPENLLGYTMQVHCPGPGDDERCQSIEKGGQAPRPALNSPNLVEQLGASPPFSTGSYDVTVVDHCKLFRNRADLRFEGRIHEQVLAAINRAGGDVVFTDLFVVHAGADHTRDGRRRKLRRDLRLLRLELREKPDHTFVHFNLGMTYADAGKHAKAIAALRRSRELAQPHESHVRKIYALLVASHRELGQRAEAWQACREGLYLFPKDPELLFREAMLAHEDGRLREAELAYLGALANDDAVHFGSIDRGIVGFKARQNLAAVYAYMGQPRRAEEQWRAIVADVPGYRAGWQGLVENLITQRKLGEAETAAARLMSAEPRLRGTGVALAARVAEARGDIEAARELLRRGVADCPGDAAPLEELCRLLFERGPAAEAEAALRELARRQPADGAAQHNLGTLLLRGGDARGAVEAFRESLARRPRAAVTHLSLGYALHGAGRGDEAEAAFRECLHLAPDTRLAAEAQRQLVGVSA